MVSIRLLVIVVAAAESASSTQWQVVYRSMNNPNEQQLQLFRIQIERLTDKLLFAEEGRTDREQPCTNAVGTQYQR